MKKALHYFNRGLVMGLEFFALLIVLAFLLWGALLWRLSTGPLDASFLTEKLEASMNARQPGFVFDIGSTQLVWGGHFDLFQVEMKNVTVRRADGADIITMRKVGVHLSKRHLVFGQLTPKLVRVYEPALRVVRWEDGHVTLNFDAQPAEVFGPPLPPEWVDKNSAAQIALLQSVLQGLNDHSALGMLIGGLEEIAIRDARVTYDDRALGLELESSDTDIALGRTRSGIRAKINLATALSPDRRMGLVIEGRYRRDTGESDIIVQFAGADPSVIAAYSEKLSAWRGLSVPLAGSMSLLLDRGFRPVRGRFILGAEEGRFSGFGLYDDKTPLPLGRIYAKGSLDFTQQALRLDTFKADLRGPQAEGQASITRAEDGRFRISASAALTQMPMDDLANYWPETLTPDPRWWVTTHLSKGIATKATLETDMFFNPAPAEGAAAIDIEKLGGIIDFEGIKVDYLPPLMPVEKVRGQARYDTQRFDLAITGGMLGDMTVSKSAIAITGLADNDPDSDIEIDIQVSVAGPVVTAFKVLDSKPLGYTQMLGINSAAAGGKADVDLSLRFPIHRGLDIADVQVAATAKLDDMRLPAMVAGMDITGGPMTLQVDSGALNVKGNGKLGDMPITFDWSKNFDRKKPFDSSVTAELTLSDAARRAFGVPEMAGLRGPLPSKIAYRLEHGGKATLDVTADLAPATLSVPDIGFSKPAGTAGSLSLRVFLAGGAPQRVGNISVETGGLVLRGEADVTGGTLRKASFPTAMWGQTQAAVDIETRGGGYVLRITGRQFDAGRWMQDDGVPNSDAVAAVKTMPLQISMNVDRLLVNEGRVLEKVKMFLRRNEWQRIEQLEIDGMIGKDDIYLRYTPSARGPSLRFEAQNAGAALAFFGISKSIRGGKLVVRGEPAEKGGPRDMRGSVVLSDFILRDAPVLALLLNSMSLVGVLDLLNGDGIAFKRARVNFNWIDRGQPAQQKNIRQIRLRDGRTSGASLGLNFEGEIDNWAKTLDLDGTIIPISGINNVLSGIPLVGDILTGGGGGILAATYSIKGPIDKPRVSVNPLSVLAPGILRKIFFEN
ncbi:MAG: AsmA-like C-terminal domain-containing protein [Alphaproteobacteria bacterium]